MASLHRRRGSKFWQCSFYVPTEEGGSKQLRQSTGTTNRREADRRAMELEKAARDSAGVSPGKGSKINSILQAAAEDAMKERLTITKARTYLSEILKLSTGEELNVFTIQQWADEWLGRKRSTVGKATVQRYEGSCRAFLGWLGEERSGKPLESITTTHIREFRDSLREGRLPTTVNALVKDVGSIFREAVNEGIIGSNPVTALKSLPPLGSTTRTPFSPGEVQRLMAGAPSDDWRGLVLVGAYTGLRLGDCAGLTWGNIDFEAGTLTVIPKKTRLKGIEVKIPLAAPLREFLEGHPISDDPKASLFPSLAEASVSGKKGLSMTFGRLMDECGVSRGEKHASGMHERGFHALRHTFTSWLANAGVAPELREAMTGHLDSDTHKLYTHHTPASLRAAIDSLPGLTDS